MRVKSKHVRNRLERRLLQSRKELLWSYNKEKINSLSDEFIINTFLVSGNAQDWQDLKNAYEVEEIKEVWKDNILLGGFRPEKQKELVAFFFNSQNPSIYISQNKRRKLEKAFARSY